MREAGAQANGLGHLEGRSDCNSLYLDGESFGRFGPVRPAGVKRGARGQAPVCAEAITEMVFPIFVVDDAGLQEDLHAGSEIVDATEVQLGNWSRSILRPCGSHRELPRPAGSFNANAYRRFRSEISIRCAAQSNRPGCVANLLHGLAFDVQILALEAAGVFDGHADARRTFSTEERGVAFRPGGQVLSKLAL